jgi:hypothetical protein
VSDLEAELYQSNLWLYPLSYEELERSNRSGLRPPAVLLEKCRHIAVVGESNPPEPRLPCLGLQALVLNNLRLVVNGDGATFCIRKSWRSFLGRR